MGYTIASRNNSVIRLKKNSGPTNPWGDDISEIFFTSANIGSTLNVKIYVPGQYEPPLDLPRNPSYSEDRLQVVTQMVGDVFTFAVKRNTTDTTLFDTSPGPLIFSDKFLQLVISLPSDAMYGWGENVHPSLKHRFSEYKTWAMLARDQATNAHEVSTRNLYGVHPFYIVIEPDGKAHGVLILNSNAQEVTTAPGPTVIYRTTGGILDLYFFPGPEPEEVIQQYLALIGKPFFPAYWALGFQISRYGYKDFEEMKNVIERNIRAGIPMDTVVVDIDYMDGYKDFTIGEKWKELPTYIKQLRTKGMRSVLIFDPAIEVNYDVFKRAREAQASFIEWERADQVMRSIQELYPLAKDTKIMLGVVWPDDHVAFPDFLDPTNATTEWWIKEFKEFWKVVPYDGIWIDMNEPANFGTNENEPFYFIEMNHKKSAPLFCPRDGEDAKWDMPPYKTHAVFIDHEKTQLAAKTLCMLAVQAKGTQRFYNVKNLYGLSESIATQSAQHKVTGKRGAVISRSTFVSSGHYAGHWLGDNAATWEDLQAAVIGVQEFNMFGIPYVGSDICGFNQPSNVELCLRWQQLGAFHPFMRNHNAIGELPQDPAQWPAVATATIQANRFRYSYLPYLYSLHWYASSYGGTVVRPVFFEYPDDPETYDLGYQFMWGSSLLILPVVYKEATNVYGYLPKDYWYSLYDYKYGQRLEPGRQTLPAPWSSLFPVLVRGGSILPRQKPNSTTEYTRANPFELLIVPGSKHGNKRTAKGVLFWDDGESIAGGQYVYEFMYVMGDDDAALRINLSATADIVKVPPLDTLEIFDYQHMPDFESFETSERKLDLNMELSHYDDKTKILYLSGNRLVNMEDIRKKNHQEVLTWKNMRKPESQKKTTAREETTTDETITNHFYSTSEPEPSVSKSTNAHCTITTVFVILIVRLR